MENSRNKANVMKSATSVKNGVKTEKKAPLVVANVNLGKGRSDKLVLLEGMLIDDQIQAFAIKNGKLNKLLNRD